MNTTPTPETRMADQDCTMCGGSGWRTDENGNRVMCTGVAHSMRAH